MQFGAGAIKFETAFLRDLAVSAVNLFLAIHAELHRFRCKFIRPDTISAP
jgi:hypothetical protein